MRIVLVRFLVIVGVVVRSNAIDCLQAHDSICGRVVQFHSQEFCSFISALRGMPARTSDERGVRLSVCLSVCQTREL